MAIIYGALTYKEKKYQFHFENFQLQIYEPGKQDIDDLGQICGGIAKELDDENKPVTLFGTCYPDGHQIIFLDALLGGFINFVQTFYVRHYIENEYPCLQESDVSEIGIVADELNFIFPVKGAYKHDKTGEGFGMINLEHLQRSNDWLFSLDNKPITAHCGYELKVSSNNPCPLQIQSVLYFKFETTNDYEFVCHLVDIGKQLLEYLCYRKNVNITRVNVYREYENGHGGKSGFFNAKWLKEPYPEDSENIRRKFISIELLGNSLSNLLQNLADNKLYLRHLPRNIADQTAINPANTVLLTAAFEGECSRVYPEGIELPQNIKEVRELAITGLESLVDNPEYKSAIPEFKRLIGQLKSPSLSVRLEHALNDYSDCIEVFAKYLFAYNQVEYSLSLVAKTISRMRNDFSHGDLNADYGVDTYLSIKILPYLIYAMQLRAVGMDTVSIKRSINNLFELYVKI